MASNPLYELRMIRLIPHRKMPSISTLFSELVDLAGEVDEQCTKSLLRRLAISVSVRPRAESSIDLPCVQDRVEADIGCVQISSSQANYSSAWNTCIQ